MIVRRAIPDRGTTRGIQYIPAYMPGRCRCSSPARMLSQQRPG